MDGKPDPAFAEFQRKAMTYFAARSLSVNTWPVLTTRHEGHEVFYSIPEKTLWLSVSSVVKIIYLFRHLLNYYNEQPWCQFKHAPAQPEALRDRLSYFSSF